MTVETLVYAGLFFLVGCVLALAVFLARYLFTEWNKSREGRYMMIFALILFSVLATTLLGYFFASATLPWLIAQVAELFLLFSVLVGLDVLLFKAQRRKKRRRAEVRDEADEENRQRDAVAGR